MHIFANPVTNSEMGRCQDDIKKGKLSEMVCSIYVTESAKTDLICTKCTYLFYHIYLFLCEVYDI